LLVAGEESVLICTAVIVGGIRLIDNLLAEKKHAD
jgi:pantothenate synthetase